VAAPAIGFGKPSQRQPSPAMSGWWMAAVVRWSTGACRSRSGSSAAGLAFCPSRKCHFATESVSELKAKQQCYGDVTNITRGLNRHIGVLRPYDIAFGGEDGGVSERKLNLFERGAPFMCQLQTCVSEEEPFPGARTGTILPAFPPYRHAGSKEKSPIHFHRHFPEFMVMAWCLDENPGFLRTYPGFHLSAYQHMGVTD